MKEILRSKVMVGFIFFVLGICYVNTVDINSQTNMKEESNNIIVLNEN